jgi:ABC-type transport system involved in multi-copper enzyme maturation permease subunit
MPDLRLISAELLKLRRRRGMLSIALLLTAGAALLVFAVMAIQHAGDAARYGPAGGLANYQEDISFLGMMVLVVGAIVGATAGTQDIESGVFRDLAATGRSRLALFFSRVGGAWAVALPIAGLAAGITAVGSVALAGSLAAPGAGALVAGTAALLAGAALSTAMGVGLSTLVGSRGPVIGVLLAFFLAIQPLLAGIRVLGGAREFIPYLALERIGDMPQSGSVQVALGTAILAVILWAAAALGFGAWRTRTREI